MKKIEGNKLVALLISASMVTVVLAACTVDYDKLNKGINDLGRAIDGKCTVETSATVTEADTSAPISATEESSAEETTPVPTGTATPSPTPTPTEAPAAERVDFSDYSVDILSYSENFEVTTEEFEESSHSEEDDEVLFATFAGTRMVVTSAGSDNIRDAINLIVDGFYKEAEGAYKRMADKAKAELTLNGVIEEPYAVNVDFEYMTNGRTFSVLMSYTVEGRAEDETMVVDFASFDMLTGQYITLATVTNYPVNFENSLRTELENAIKSRPAQGEATEEDEEEVTTPSADEFEKIFVGPTSVETQNHSYAMVYGIADGQIYSSVIEMDAYADFFNRYGASVFLG